MDLPTVSRQFQKPEFGLQSVDRLGPKLVQRCFINKMHEMILNTPSTSPVGTTTTNDIIAKLLRFALFPKPPACPFPVFPPDRPFPIE